MNQPTRITGVAAVEEGYAKKFLVDVPDGGPPRELVLCRVDGRLHALDSLCPHAGGRLAEGPLMQGRYAHCPLHLYKFDPEDGRSIEIECAPAAVYEVREEGDVALVELRDAPSPPRPELDGV
jgi:nitrite reductase/ring-hydroxylating ferredoxin subunit